MMSHKPKQPETRKVFDVMRPGRTAASSTSRPVIVGHKPQVKDPMVSDEEPQLMDSKQKVQVEPTGAPALPQDDHKEEATTTPSAPVQPESTTPISHVPQKDEAYPADGLASIATSSMLDSSDEKKTDDQAEEQTGQSTPYTSSSSPQESQNTAPNEQQTDSTTGIVFDDAPAPATQRTAQVDSEPLPVLPDEEPMQQQIVISHHKHTGGGKVVLVIISLLILGLLVFDILLDAGILVIDGIPHTDLF